jgi:hypothetical protein
MKKEENSVLWTKDFIFIILINFFIFANHIMCLTTFPFYIQKLGRSDALAGTTALMFFIIAVIFRPFVGLILDGGKRKIILFIGLFGMALFPAGFIAVSLLPVVLC